MNIELLAWATGSLVLFVVFVLSGRLQRFDYFMLLAIVLVIGSHFFYWFSGGPDFGARYWFLTIVPLGVVTARALRSFGDAAVTGAMLLCAMSLATFVPWRAIDKYHNYRGFRPGIEELAEAHQFGRSLVLIEGKRDEDYASAAIYNPIDLQAPVPVYAWSRDDRVTRNVIEAYRDRSIWIVRGPSVTGTDYEVSSGPTSANHLLESLGTRPDSGTER